MHSVLIALTATEARHYKEIGALIGAVGAGVLFLAGVAGLRSSGFGGRWVGLTLAGILMAVGFVLLIIGLHYGP